MSNISSLIELNQNKALLNNKICKTECLLKFNFIEQSTSFKACLNNNDSIIENPPNIQITNEFLSNTTNTGTMAVNFQTMNYWFNSLYITKPGYLYIDYIVEGLYDNGVLNTTNDASACSLTIECIDSSKKNYLLITQLIVKKASISSTPSSTELNNLINNIKSVLDANDISFNNISCTDSQTVSLSTVNLNNFIPTTNKFFYHTYKDDNGNTFHNIMFNSILPINISNNNLTYINNFYDQSYTTNKSIFSSNQYNILRIPNNINSVFISSQLPINNLSEGEDDIYIKCQPTNQEGEVLVSGTSIAPLELPSFNLDDAIGKNLFVSAALGIVVMIIILKGGELLFKNTGNIL